ncbi:MAG: transglycosylase SLT domain-containing protein [Rikenellaceae bacterium]
MKRYIILLLLLLIPLITTITNYNSKYVIIGVERGAAGIFIYNNEPNGYLYDMAKEWAKTNKKRLVIHYYDEPQDLLKGVERSDVDFGLLIGEKENKKGVFTCFTYGEVYSIISTVKLSDTISERTLLDSMRGKSLYLSDGALHTQFYKRLKEVGVECDVALDDSVSTTYTIDREILNNIRRFNDKRVLFSQKFQDTLFATLVTSSPKKQIKFESWYGSFLKTRKGEALVKLYSRENLFSNYINNGYIRPISRHSVSKYDDLFKEIASKEDLDWRLLSAIAFVESKYHNDVISPNGAVGIMQIMPQTGAVHGRDKDALLSPYVNISTAAKHLHIVARKLKINGKAIAKEDRLAILIAAYNCGHGHMQDVIRLTSAGGKDPNKWEDVSFYLSKMNNSEYYDAPNVQFGKFNGSVTVNYVNEVLDALHKIK